ncbi:hypothetical protein [Pseudoclavibacter sp. AY1H1]|uniref:hypothetical protein n=1 Tax=Pseudoclavibacter sp. AY1H1 TaxID=2080584 RepID=UPI000CE934D2|nr:hypothetical protein [Pseudoclavibacter sp. AY1H1]PPF39990.1 hypothetical protein C5E05_01895 [Pseudoclavibacter sp. AY1H1]
MALIPEPIATQDHVRYHRFGGALVLLVVAAVLVVLTTGAALAPAAATDAPIIEFTLSWVLILQLVIGSLLPILVGLVTKASWSGGVKGVLLAALSFATSIASSLLNSAETGTPYDIGQGILLGFATFVTAVAVHYGILKGSGISAAAQASGVHDGPKHAA